VDIKELVNIAVEIRENAYSPYSKFRVGAAALMEGGKIFSGVNIENASFGATCCAERVAVFKAVSDGETKLKAIAIASDSEDFTYPCGICRQVMAEFGDDKMQVICSNKNGEYKMFTLGEILPNAFRIQNGGLLK